MANRRNVDRRVVDTNVLATANGHHRDAPIDCIAECAARLQAIMESGHVVLDDGWRILRQYTANLEGAGAGQEFLQWLYQNRCNQERCTEVPINTKPHDLTDFDEVPAPLDLPPGEQIDPSDRVFLAVAATHKAHPPILQATDSKWIGWEPALRTHGIEIEWVCRDYAEATYARKMSSKVKAQARGVRRGRAGSKARRR